MISSIISRLVILVFGTLYPAYASYKAVRTKNLKEYVKWMMYWIVFALFTCAETFTDVFLSWFPFYYEVKVVLVVWLLSPATRGSSILYRKFVHPALCRREQEIDEYIAKAKDQGYHTVLNLGTKGVNYATTVIMQTAIKGGGGLVQQLRKSYSLSDLSEDSQHTRAVLDEMDDVLAEARVVKRVNVGRRAYNRSASESNSRSAIYFTEVDVDLPGRRGSNDVQDFSHIKSSEDISSGYSSADNSIAIREGSLTRADSIGARTRQGARQAAAAAGSRTGLTNIKRPAAAEDYDLTQEYGGNNPHLNTAYPIYRVLNTNPPFLLECIGSKVNVIQVLSDTSDIDNENIEYFDSKNDKTDEESYLDITENTNLATRVSNKSLNLSKTDLLSKHFERTLPSGHVEASSHTEDIEKESIVDVASITGEITVDSDNEASFGTPEDSPKTKKKLGKGKYGKTKAPSPPKELTRHEKNFVEQDFDLGNIKTKYSTGDRGITKRKKRHKSHSPCSKKINKNESTISKFINLSGKLAFWNKNVSGKNTDNISSSSSEDITKVPALVDLGKTIERIEPKCEMIYQSLPVISITNQGNDNSDVGNEIINKSNALQQLINEKIESHPEYRRISLHEDEDDIPSKSTAV